jgi:hypothetical protein
MLGAVPSQGSGAAFGTFSGLQNAPPWAIVKVVGNEKTMHRVRTILILLIAVASLSAAGAQSAVPPAPVALGMEVRVPLILRVSVGGSWDTVLQLSGFVGTYDRDKRSIMIAPFSIAELGKVKVFSNCEGSYAISIRSGSGGFLANKRTDSLIPYSLVLNGAQLRSHEGVFTYDTAGKSAGRGTLYDLKLVFDDLDESLPQGLYDDNLTFSIASR